MESIELADDVKPKRRYESQHRREQAETTRRAVLTAAKARFETAGYAATTIAEIAKDAGVSSKTVYLAFETKSGLLRALWNLLLRDGREEQPVAEQRWYLDVLEEKDPERQLRRNAHNSATGKQRISRLLEVIRSAAPLDDEIAALWRRIQSDYRQNQGAIVERLAEQGGLAPGLDTERATDILWTINHPSTWQLLVVERGWTPQEYEQWTADLACRELLDPGRDVT